MYKLTEQFADYFAQMMQVINWGDLIGRTFRPVITPNTLLNGSIRSGEIGYSPVYVHIQSYSRPVTHFYRVSDCIN